MSNRKVEVILLDSVPDLGEAGSLVKVAEGFARNHLFPDGLAALATTKVKRKEADKKAIAEAAASEELQKQRELAESLDGTELTMKARVKEGAEIFGSITNQHIVKELNAQANLELKPRQIEIAEPLGEIGEYDVTIHLAPDVTAALKVLVINEEQEEHAREE